MDIEEERRDISAVKYIFQVVGRAALLLEGLLELAVERRELLVERLQLLLRRQQFLVGRLVFFVDGEQLFVDRPLLVARNLQAANGVFQLAPRRFELLLQCRDARAVACGGRLLRPARLLRIVDEADQKQFIALTANRLHGDAEEARHTVAVGPPAGDDDTLLLLACPLDRRADLDPHSVAHHRKQIGRRMSRGDPQVAVSRTQGIEAFALAVDQDRSRRIVLQNRLSAEFGQRGLARGNRAGQRPSGLTKAFAGVHGKAALSRPAGGAMPIDARGLGDHFEAVVSFADRLRAAKQENAPLPQREMEKRDHLRLCLGLQVDEQVPA